MTSSSCPDRWKPTEQIDVVLRVLPAEMTGRTHELKEKGSYLIYVGSAETPVRFRLLESSQLRSGESGVAQMHLRDPLLLARGDRFVLRDAGRILTFGGGVVADPLPDRAHRLDTERIALVKRLVTADAESALGDLLDAEGKIDLRTALFRSGASEPAGTAHRERPLFGGCVRRVVGSARPQCWRSITRPTPWRVGCRRRPCAPNST